MSSYDRFRSNMYFIASIRGRILGRVDLQKTVFLAQELGLFIPFTFRWRKFGPYSPELDHGCNHLIADGILQREGSSFLPGDVNIEEESLNEITSFTEEDAERFEQLCTDLWESATRGSHSFPQFMECIASLQFLRRRFRGTRTERERTFALLRMLKARRMNVLGPMMEDAWEILEAYFD